MVTSVVTSDLSPSTPKYKLHQITEQPGSGLQPDGTCKHWWKIEGGTGRKKFGECIHCHEGKWFANMNLIRVSYQREVKVSESSRGTKTTVVEVEREWFDKGGSRGLKVVELGAL